MKHFIGSVLLGLISIAWIVQPAEAQFDITPSWNWQQTESDHFRVYYPKPFEEWTLNIASRLESIHEEVVSIVGYEPDRKVDVIVMDPMGMPNGMALPLMDSPRIILWACPPDASSSLNGYTDWGELVSSHEYSHIVHLTRSPRNPIDRLLAWILPVGTIALKAPVWAIEGYAVILEGKLTGSGRPNTSMRAAVVRQWAIEGRLPEFSSLNGSEKWMAYSMPYLVGSAFLEWLELRSNDPDIFTKLWRRMTAHKRRTFDDAFEGLFGDSAENLYNRFRAELTADAMGIERSLDGSRHEGVLWQDTSDSTDPMDISPDGTRMTLVIRDRHRPPRLVVWSIDEISEDAINQQKQIAKMQEKDPEDIPDQIRSPLSRKEIAVFSSRSGIMPFNPRWMPDGQSILFHAHVQDSEGLRHPDLFQWFPDTGSFRQLTQKADLKHVDPSPSGGWLVAVRQQWGRSELVKIDLNSGIITSLTQASIDSVISNPRVAPDGNWIAAIESSKTQCKLILIHTQTGESKVMVAESRENLMHPEWISSTQLMVVSDRSGILNIERIDIDRNWERVPLTRVLGSALWPQFNSIDQSVFYLDLTADGLAIRRLSSPSVMEQTIPIERKKWVMPPAEYPPLKDHRELPIESQPYRTIEHLELKTLWGGTWLPSGDSFEVGLRMGDIIGRLDAIALGSVGWNGGASGGTLGLTYRGWPIRFGLQGSQQTRSFSDQRDLPESSHPAPDHERTSVQLTADWHRFWHAGSLSIGMNALTERIDIDNSSEKLDHQLVSAHTGLTTSLQFGRVTSGIGLRLMAQSGWMKSEQRSHFIGQMVMFTQLSDVAYLSVYATEGRMDGHSDWLNRFSIGGVVSSVDLTADIRSHLQTPYLPAYSMVGDSIRRLRYELGSPSQSPLVVFFEQTECWGDFLQRDTVRVAGIEMVAGVPAMPIVKFPEVQMRIGAVRFFNGELEDRWRGYVSLSYRP